MASDDEVQAAMFVIRLANGNLLVPESALTPDGRVMGDAYVEISPADAAYARLAAQAVSQEEYEARQRRWRDGDEQLRREFLDYLARHGSGGGWHDDDADG
jgi:hypothetical protein